MTSQLEGSPAHRARLNQSTRCDSKAVLLRTVLCIMGAVSEAAPARVVIGR